MEPLTVLVEQRHAVVVGRGQPSRVVVPENVIASEGCVVYDVHARELRYLKALYPLCTELLRDSHHVFVGTAVTKLACVPFPDTSVVAGADLLIDGFHRLPHFQRGVVGALRNDDIVIRPV